MDKVEQRGGAAKTMPNLPLCLAPRFHHSDSVWIFQSIRKNCDQFATFNEDHLLQAALSWLGVPSPQTEVGLTQVIW